MSKLFYRNLDAQLKFFDGAPMFMNQQDQGVRADFTTVHDGTKIVQIKHRPALIRLALADLLTAPTEEKIGFEEKDSRYKMAKKIAAGGIIGLSQAELATIVSLVQKIPNLLLVGQLMEALEEDVNPPDGVSE